MHSGGGSGVSVVSVAPATPINKHMIGIAALVLEGRERTPEPSRTSKDMPYMGSASTTSVVMPRVAVAGTSSASSSGSSSNSTALYATAEAPAVATALATSHSSNTAIMSTFNWARTQNNRLAHIYRLKNKLLMESSHNGGDQGRSSPVAMTTVVDYDQGVFVDDGGAIFDPMQHLTAPRICRLRTPRSFLSQQQQQQVTVSERRQGSSSSSSCSSSNGSAASPALGRRNSRTSPVPHVITMGARTHCDEFLRTIGLIKGGGGGGGGGGSGTASPAVPPKVGKGSPNTVVEEELSHFCDEVVSTEVSKGGD